MSRLGAVVRVLLGEMRRRPGPALATVAAMAAGLAVFTAIWLAGGAARSSFVSAVEAVAGRATHEVTRPGGVDEARFAALASLDAVRAAEPIVEGVAAVTAVRRDGRSLAGAPPPLRVLGIDPFQNGAFGTEGAAATLVTGDTLGRLLTEPATVLLPAPWAEGVGARTGDTLRVVAAGRAVTLTVIGVYGLEVFGEAARDVAVVDLATAQEVLGRLGRLDRVSLIVTPEGEATVAAALGPGERLERPARRGERVARMMDAFQLNLLALGALALVVGALLIYNAAGFAVVRRQALLGRLRCLGADRGTLLAAFLAEAILFGLVGGAIGLGVGVWLAQHLVGGLAQTVTDLYAFVRVEIAPLTPLTAAALLLAAALTSGVAAFFPAFDASRTPPRLVGLGSREELAYRGKLSRLVAAGAIALLLGAGAAALPLASWWPGVAAAFLCLLGGAALLPPIMAVSLPAVARAGERLGGVRLPLAAGTLSRSLTRTGGAAAALGVALAMTVAIIVMVASYRSEVNAWLGGTLRADLYVSDLSESAGGHEGRVPAAALARIAARPEVRAIERKRFLEAPYGDRTVLLSGADFPVAESLARFRFLAGDPSTALAQLRRGAVLVSEPLANRHDLGPGDRLRVPGRDGEVALEIVGVFRDFSVDRGYAVTASEPFVRRFGDPGVLNASVYLRRGADPETVGAALRAELAADFALQIRSNASLRARVFEVFDQTFALTYVLQVIATVMALFGIAVTLVGLFLERGREVATLRALGSSLRGLVGLFTCESLLLAIFPVAAAFPVGGVLAWILIDIVNLRSFGWSIGMVWPWGPVLMTCALAGVAACVAVTVPWMMARRQGIAGALREE